MQENQNSKEKREGKILRKPYHHRNCTRILSGDPEAFPRGSKATHARTPTILASPAVHSVRPDQSDRCIVRLAGVVGLQREGKGGAPLTRGRCCIGQRSQSCGWRRSRWGLILLQPWTNLSGFLFTFCAPQVLLARSTRGKVIYDFHFFFFQFLLLLFWVGWFQVEERESIRATI